MLRRWLTILLFVFPVVDTASPQLHSYPWLADYDSLNSIACLVKLPDGYKRIEVEAGSYSDWLRQLPIRNTQHEIYQYDGKKVTEHAASYAVIDIDVGDRDLQQCGDAIIRFRADYLFSKSLYDSIAFTFTSGDTAYYTGWRAGLRPNVKAQKVEWSKLAEVDSSYSGFREYLDSVFMYAGTYSLSKEMKQVKSVDSIQIGDFFVLGGFPGHAVIVADMAVTPADRRKLFLLIQGYTPAQDIHIIKNPARDDGLPWFELPAGDTLEILHWKFTEKHLRRF